MSQTNLTTPAADTPIKLHAIKAVCDMTDLSRFAIYRLVSAGELARVKIGSRTLIPDDALRSFIAAHRT